jgi:hypothetical protein
MAHFVQLPHRKEEAPYLTGGVANSGTLARPDGRTYALHKRKFLSSGGLHFWGEWEPESHIAETWPRDGNFMPRALHEPYWTSQEYLLDTDPWVWGETFVWSDCRQLHGPGGLRDTPLRHLQRGDVVLFGSTTGSGWKYFPGSFVVDTVFVVGSAEPWTPAGGADVNDAFTACVVDPLTREPARDRERTLYRGATPDEPVDGMYSFVPAARTGRFERPALEHPFINPSSWRVPYGSATDRTSIEVRKAWRSVRQQVRAAGLQLGTSFDIPAKV